MDFIYQGPITTELKKNCSNRVKEIWNELQGTSPDQDFVDYVELLISNKKSLQEISNELQDVGLNGENARTFAEKLGAFLSNQTVADPQVSQIDSTPVKPIVLTTIVSNNTSTVSLEPLKASRFNNSDSSTKRNKVVDGRSDPAVKTNKLLNSALQSTRKNAAETPKPSFSSDPQQSSSSNSNNHHNNEKSALHSKRGRESDAAPAQSKQADSGPLKRQVIYQPPMQQQQHQLQHQPPVFYNYSNPPHPPLPQQQRVAMEGSAATPLLETVKYFEEMNNIAKKSGFQNAQEMLASQKEMMSLMAAATVPAPAPYFQPPPPPHGFGYGPDMTGRGRGYGYQGRGYHPGRGRHGGRTGEWGVAESTAAAPQTIPPSSAAEDGTTVPPAAAAAVPGPPAAPLEGKTAEDADPLFEGGIFPGRGRGRGRRGGGRAGRTNVYYSGPTQSDGANTGAAAGGPTTAPDAMSVSSSNNDNGDPSLMNGSAAHHPFPGAYRGGRNSFYRGRGDTGYEYGGYGRGGGRSFSGRGGREGGYGYTGGRGAGGFNPFYSGPTTAGSGDGSGSSGGPPVSSNKTWVREPTVETPLSSRR